eukprot:8454204-Prorocentrum_lima.AAC.1
MKRTTPEGVFKGRHTRPQPHMTGLRRIMNIKVNENADDIKVNECLDKNFGVCAAFRSCCSIEGSV